MKLQRRLKQPSGTLAKKSWAAVILGTSPFTSMISGLDMSVCSEDTYSAVFFLFFWKPSILPVSRNRRSPDEDVVSLFQFVRQITQSTLVKDYFTYRLPQQTDNL